MLDYNDIRFYYDGETDKIQYIDVSASVCQINGTTLNKNSYELISMFGEPIYDDWTESDYQRNFIQSNWFISFSFETDSMDEIAEWIFLAQDNY